MKKLINKMKQLVGMPYYVQAVRNDVYALKASYSHSMAQLKRQSHDNLMLNAKLLAENNRKNADKIINNIQLAEFRVYSQWEDDGIIQFLVDYLDIEHKTFIEFGVENYTECNTRFLLINNKWKGLIMDGSEKNMKQLRAEELYWKYDITAVTAFIDKDNINGLIKNNGFSGEIGLLHIDIDGNDYYVWKEINVVNPVIVIMEFNSVFGIEKPWSTPYDPKFWRTEYHHSNLYFGASLLALCDLAEEKGYAFIGCNSAANNAFFVRKDKLKKLKVLTPQEGYVVSAFRESRDKQGDLTFVSGSDRLKLLKGMKIYNTRTKQTEVIE
jgi:hypothetical protein